MSQTKAQLISDLVQSLNFAGTSSAPANGLYLEAANTISLATNSNKRLSIDVNGTAVFTGTVTASSFTGNASSATSATTTVNVNLTDESSDTTCYPIFATADTGTLPPKTGSNLTFNSSTGALAATSFVGDGSALTGISAGAALTGSTNNTICTVTGANAIQGEANLTFDGTTLKVSGNSNFGDSAVSPSPSALTVKLATDKHVGFSPSQSEVGNVPALVAFQDNGSLNSMGFRGTALIFATGSAERLRIANDGKVGIGTTSPSELLHVNGIIKATRMDCDGLFHIQYGSSTNTNYMSSMSNNNGIMVLFRGDGIYVGDNMNTSNQAGGPNNQKIHLDTNGTVKVVDGSKFAAGNGTDLQMYHDSGSTESRVWHTNTSGWLVLRGDAIKIGSYTGTESHITCSHNGAVTIFHDNVEKAKTNSEGLTINGTGAGAGLLSIQAANSSSSSIEFGDTDDDDIAQIWYDHYGKNMYFRTSEAAGIMWYTNGTERMKLTDGGWFKAKGNKAAFLAGGSYHEILSDNPNNVTLALRHDSSAGYGINIQLNHTDSTKYAYQLYSISASNVRFAVRGDGDCENYNNSYGSVSDLKLKENIIDAKSQWNDIKGLRVRNFNFKDDANKTKMLGLVAQEAESVAPGLIKEIDDIDIDNKELGTKTKVLKYSILYMKAIKALQEAMTRIETVETEVNTLKTKVAALESA